MTIQDDDWRLSGQECYLANLTLRWSTWRQKRPNWDHDHCEFCYAKFAEFEHPAIVHEGYASEDQYWWVCDECAADFKVRFGWRLVGGPAASTN